MRIEKKECPLQNCSVVSWRAKSWSTCEILSSEKSFYGSFCYRGSQKRLVECVSWQNGSILGTVDYEKIMISVWCIAWPCGMRSIITISRTCWFLVLSTIRKTNSNQGMFVTMQKRLCAYQLESMAELRLQFWAKWNSRYRYNFILS